MEDSQNMQGAPAQQAPQQDPQQGGGDQMQQVVQMAQQMLEQGAQPVEVAAELLASQVPPEAIMEVFTQLGMQPEEAQATIQEAMQGGQQQQGPGEEQMEGQASNPQEEQMEGAPQGVPQQGGQPSPEEMAMMQEQQGAPQPSDEQLQQAFGGPAFNLIQKAFGGKADLNVTSESYVQDRQANFINALKQNALMNQATKQVYGEDPLKMKFGGDLPKAWDGKDMSGFKTRAEYLEAIADYNADAKNTTKLDFTAELAKWKAPAVTTTNTGQQQVQQVIGQPRYNIVYQQPSPSLYGNSPTARVYGNSYRDPGTVKINGKNVPANFNYSDLFDPGKGSGTVNGRNWTATEAEDKLGGLWNRKSVGKKYKINWETAQPTTTTTIPGTTTTTTVPGATVPGTTIPGTTIPPANEFGLRFNEQGYELKANPYDPTSFITEEQLKLEDDNYKKYNQDLLNKTYDPVTKTFVGTPAKGKVKAAANPNVGLASQYQTYGKFDANKRITDANALAKKAMEEKAIADKEAAELAKTAADEKAADDKEAEDNLATVKRTDALEAADAMYKANTNGIQRMFTRTPTQKANRFEKKQLDNAQEKVDDAEYKATMDAAKVYMKSKALGGENECPEGMIWSDVDRTCVPIAAPAESKPLNAGITVGANNKFNVNYAGAVGQNGIQTNNVGVGYQNNNTNVNANYDNANKSIMLNASKKWNVGNGELGVSGGYSTPTQGMSKGSFNGGVYYNTQLGKGDKAVPVNVNFGLGQQAFGGVLSSDLHKAAQTIMMAFGGGLNQFGLAGPTSEEDIMKRGYSLPEDNPDENITESEIEVLTKKGKLHLDWDAVADASKQYVDYGTKFALDAQQREQDRLNILKGSATNAPRNELTNQGWDQFGNFNGGTNAVADVQNLTNTGDSMNQTVSLGGKIYALGGQYDLTQKELDLLRANGINIQKS